MNRLIFHLGYPRTGSTYLQTHILPVHKQINFLGHKNYLNQNENKITHNDLYSLVKKNYDFNLESKTLKPIDKDLTKYFDKDKINFISSENYTAYRSILYDFSEIEYLEILLKNKYQDVIIDFIIVLRNQYDLIKSFYFHSYPVTSEFLKIKKFESLINLLESGPEDNNRNFPLNLILKYFNFNFLNNKLKIKFPKSKIKYLFYEDFNYEKDFFSNEFSSFCNLDKNYTLSLFNNELTNNRKTSKGNNLYYSKFIYEILNSKFYNRLKDKIPFKNLFKHFLFNSLLYSNENISSKKDKIFEQKVKNYYKFSNIEFFKNAKLINKHNY